MPAAAVEDPIGDVTDGEARISIAVETGAESEAESESAEEEPETGLKPRSPAKLERLQKILAQAGHQGFVSAEYEPNYPGSLPASTGVPKLVGDIRALCKKYSSC